MLKLQYISRLSERGSLLGYGFFADILQKQWSRSSFKIHWRCKKRFHYKTLFPVLYSTHLLQKPLELNVNLKSKDKATAE